MTIVGLQAGVAEDIQHYGSEELKQRYLPRFASGEVMGAMDLTEPQAGSDLGAIQHRARPRTATSSARRREDLHHERRLRDPPRARARRRHLRPVARARRRASRSTSCPRTLPGRNAERRRASTRLEEKLGIHGSPTAAIQFDAGRGLPRRREGRRLPAMLDADEQRAPRRRGPGRRHRRGRPRQSRIRYARERVQFGVPIARAAAHEEPPRAHGDGARGQPRAALPRLRAGRPEPLRSRRALRAQGSASSPRPSAPSSRPLHERNDTRIRLLTPLAKYMATEAADYISRDAIQVHGGLGFMAESEVGKLHSDAIITTIYEGTSEIQVSFALKEIGKGALAVVFEDVERELATLSRPELAPFADRVRRGIEQVLAAGAPWPRTSATRCCRPSRWPRSWQRRRLGGAAQAGGGRSAALRPRRVLDRAAHGRPRGSHRAHPCRLGRADRALRAHDRPGGPGVTRGGGGPAQDLPPPRAAFA